MPGISVHSLVSIWMLFIVPGLIAIMVISTRLWNTSISLESLTRVVVSFKVRLRITISLISIFLSLVTFMVSWILSRVLLLKFVRIFGFVPHLASMSFLIIFILYNFPLLLDLILFLTFSSAQTSSMRMSVIKFSIFSVSLLLSLPRLVYLLYRTKCLHLKLIIIDINYSFLVIGGVFVRMSNYTLNALVL